MYLDRKEFHRAIELYREALAIDREIGNRRDEATDLKNIGLGQYLLGNRTEAISSAEQALTIYEEIQDPGRNLRVNRSLNGEVSFDIAATADNS